MCLDSLQLWNVLGKSDPGERQVVVDQTSKRAVQSGSRDNILPSLLKRVGGIILPENRG
jgi:hypothetical protein